MRVNLFGLMKGAAFVNDQASTTTGCFSMCGRGKGTNARAVGLPSEFGRETHTKRTSFAYTLYFPLPRIQTIYITNPYHTYVVLASAVHILKLERYRED